MKTQHYETQHLKNTGNIEFRGCGKMYNHNFLFYIIL